MKTIIIFLLCFCCYQNSNAQSLELQVISSAGGPDTGNKLAWTCGENIIGGDVKLGQGFHQGSLTITPVVEKLTDLQIRIYPNPVSDEIFISFVAETVNSIQLVDNSGHLIISRNGPLQPIKIDFSSLKAGSYFLFIRNNDHQFQSYKIVKIK